MMTELDEIGPLLDILMSYSGDAFIEEVFRDTLEAQRNLGTQRSKRSIRSSFIAVQLIKNNIANSTLSEDTLDTFCGQLLDIAEKTAAADIEGLEAEEDSIINLLKQKFS